jgi:alginate O-acetyltransferase complex protein AlgI
MVFSSGEFLFLFLPLTILLYYITRLLRLPLSVSNGVLLLMSWAFYLWGSGPLLFLLIAVTAVNYACGLLIERAQQAGRRYAHVTFAAVAFNLSVLVYFKFSNFFIAELNSALAIHHRGPIAWTDVLLPIGISFYIFQAITYVVDVSRRDAPAVKNPVRFALYIALFPQLIAGPIVRYRSIAEGLRKREHRFEDFAVGASRFTHGLLKKVIVADALGVAADLAFAEPGNASMSEAWIGLIAYTLQIYFDFSGYSDMAIGLGRIFGLRIPENFRRPYSALSVTDFWRRWHMTLSTFFRDYVYVPLGGSRRGAGATYRNLVLVFFLTGLWHGANWTFVAWGAYHGALLLMERAAGWRRFEASSSGFTNVGRRLVTLGLVMIGWVIFRAESLTDALAYFGALVNFDSLSFSNEFLDLMDHQFVVTIVFASLVFLMPRDFVMGRRLAAAATAESESRWIRLALFVYVAVSLATIASNVSAQSYSPFLYFQF